MSYLIDANGEELRVGSPVVLDDIVTLTVHCWIYLTATDATARRIVSKMYADAATATTGWETLHFVDGGTDTIRFAADYATGIGRWDVDNPPQAAWFHFATTIDRSSPDNDPLMYVDAVSQTVVENTTPSGAAKNESANPVIIGNIEHGTVDSQRPLNGRIAEVTIHNVILTADEIATAMRRPVYRGLVGYWPMFNSGVDLSGNGNNATVTNATVDDHAPTGPEFGFDPEWQGEFAAAVAADFWMPAWRTPSRIVVDG